MFMLPNEVKSPLVIKSKAPTNPVKTPMYCKTLGLLLKTATPIMRTKNGVRLFNIAERELEILAADKVNKNAGKKFPKNPETIKNPMFALLIRRKFFIENGSKIRKLKKMRIAAT